MKIFSIVGARPQFIKLAPLSAALAPFHEEILVHTGQHYDYAMSGRMFRDLGIRNPDVHLEVQKDNSTVQVAEMILKLEKEMIRVAPDLVLVFGDTNSTLAGALAAEKCGVPLLHIEAGLRSFNRAMPEELNRVTADHIASYLFAPSPTAVSNLHKEGLTENITLTGDIMVDTLHDNLEAALQFSTMITQLGLEKNAYYLLTLHRNYNVDDAATLVHILSELGKLEETIVFPMHPRTRKMLHPNFEMPRNILLTEPLGYLDFITLEYYAAKIITDSGGIQKEAYLLKKPCITLRTETEWVETVEEKWNLLLNPGAKNLVNPIREFSAPVRQYPIFGNKVAAKMVEAINRIRL